jgi:hypothetical protein
MTLFALRRLIEDIRAAIAGGPDEAV